MAITKILNIQESEGRNPASHLKNALKYIQNPDKTEECVLVGGINCLADTAFEQMEETKNIFHKTGKRQGYHVIISFSPEEKVTAEQAMYVLEHFAKDVLGDDYEAVYAVHTDREHMHGHLIWNSVSMTTGKKYNSPKSNWKNHLQPITNKYCDELGLSIMPAEYSRNPKNISRDKWEKEMSMKEIILRDAKMCAYAAGKVEHFKYLMKRLGYVFKKDAWMEVQATGFRYYHKLAKLDEMFSEDMLRHHVDMLWMAKPYFYSSDIRGLHRAKLSPFQKKFYAKLYRLRIVEQKRFVVGGAKYTEDLKRFHRLQDEYLLLVNNDIKDVVELVDFRSKQKEKIQQIEDRQKAIYRENSSRKRSIKTKAQYREYQIWHVEVQEELDELKQEKKEIKRLIQLADGIVKEDLYTAYYAVSENEEIVADRDVEIPGMEDNKLVEITTEAVVEQETNVEVMNPNNIQNEIGRQKDQTDSVRKQQTDLDGIGISEIHNSYGVNVARMDESITDVTDKTEFVEIKETEPVDKADRIVRRISELGGYENVSDSVKADIFGFDIADVGGSIRLFSEVMKRLEIKLDGDELYEEFQKIYDESVGRDTGKEKAEDKIWNNGRGR
ncbi:relaxase/mobilization nuclease domain-containing protein [Roseburia sp. MSJ-14]|uniref:relaxase/mobilization nuclease domain-containing protein n=1 Tax=Roseburia sp. MSJ-14 TaxID=2841514 RepID=UPI001C123605|nr:relaxase/mobilization nuclease domain-containing protein [Roseburia sp. MSJ-14]MBU5474908.1 relaxase/mobilization nuclease domain-containing protein [Roseburia sp. MSJ-14]